MDSLGLALLANGVCSRDVTWGTSCDISTYDFHLPVKMGAVELKGKVMKDLTCIRRCSAENDMFQGRYRV